MAELFDTILENNSATKIIYFDVLNPEIAINVQNIADKIILRK